MERLSVINKRLEDYYGTDTITGVPIFRVVWSHDEMETRLMGNTDSGIVLLTPEYRQVPKYRHYINNKWVLEKFVIVPDFQQKEIGSKVSYEPLYVFMNAKQQFLPYNWEAIQFVIDSVLAATGKTPMGAKYVDPDIDQPLEKRQARIKKLQEELFGNETSIGDALAHREGVAGFHSKMVN